MLERGAFDGVGLALMVHPVQDGLTYNPAGTSAQAVGRYKATFTGKAAHAAAAPHQGVNAADAAVLSQVAIGLLRQQIPGDHRIACYVAEAGHVTNIIPERAVVQFECRAFTLPEYEALLERVRRCFEGAALATGTTLAIEATEPLYEPLLQDDALAAHWTEAMDAFGKDTSRSAGLSGGSTDMGNISQVIPSLHPWLSIPGADVPIHSHAFAALADIPGGVRGDVRGSHRAGLDRRRRSLNPHRTRTLHPSGIPPSYFHPGRHIMSTSTKTARIRQGRHQADASRSPPWPSSSPLAVQFIGQAKIDLGIGAIIIFPMVWGLILGLLVSVQKFKPLGLDLQRVAAALVGVAVLLLVARLAFNIGPSLPSLLKAGPALLLQEVGHLLGTIVLALPLAVLLRMGKATVGATFSLDREPSFAMVSEKYGPDSDQYRGVLAMYVFGTLFGAVFITLLTSLVANWKIFDPLALAMGAGVGSGSMMAASVGQHHRRLPRRPGSHPRHGGRVQPDHHRPGRLRRHLHRPAAGGPFLQGPHPQADPRSRGRRSRCTPGATAERQRRADIEREEAQAEENRRFREQVAESSAAIRLPLWLSLSVLTVLGIGTASVAAKGFSLTIVGGYGIMLALVLVSIALAKVTRKISAIVYITTIGAYISSPWFFGAEALTAVIKTSTSCPSPPSC